MTCYWKAFFFTYSKILGFKRSRNISTATALPTLFVCDVCKSQSSSSHGISNADIKSGTHQLLVWADDANLLHGNMYTTQKTLALIRRLFRKQKQRKLQAARSILQYSHVSVNCTSDNVDYSLNMSVDISDLCAARTETHLNTGTQYPS
jgi:transcription elongation factor Elf1